MKKMSFIPAWTLAAPIAGWLILAGSLLGTGGWYALLMTIGLFASVLAAVHHAEVVAHRVGEPFGTLILALAVTVIEVALIVSLKKSKYWVKLVKGCPTPEALVEVLEESSPPAGSVR